MCFGLMVVAGKFYGNRSLNETALVKIGASAHCFDFGTAVIFQACQPAIKVQLSQAYGLISIPCPCMRLRVSV